MIESHRYTYAGSPKSRPLDRRERQRAALLRLHFPFERHGRAWVDALDPTLPSDLPVLVKRPEAPPPQHPHKLILRGASLSAGALIAGYLAAFLLL